MPPPSSTPLHHLSQTYVENINIFTEIDLSPSKHRPFMVQDVTTQQAFTKAFTKGPGSVAKLPHGPHIPARRSPGYR